MYIICQAILQVIISDKFYRVLTKENDWNMCITYSRHYTECCPKENNLKSLTSVE